MRFDTLKEENPELAQKLKRDGGGLRRRNGACNNQR
jgi:hypothetical protein